MKKIKKVLLSVALATPAVALGQPAMISSEALGYLERGKKRENQMQPSSRIALITLRKPAILAPTTKLPGTL